MKKEIKFSTLINEKIEIIDDEEFIRKLKKCENQKEYMELELLRKDEIQKIIESIEIDRYTNNEFNYVRTINCINEKGKVEKTPIIYGQIFIIDYKRNILNIVDKKIYKNHFEKISGYSYSLKDVGIIDKEIKVILNYISEIYRNQKNNCKFLLYILANRKRILKSNTVNIQLENEIDNLLKLWNITEKYYSYEQYKICLKLYEEVYMDYLKNNSYINLSQYESIKKQMIEKRKEILKGD